MPFRLIVVVAALLAAPLRAQAEPDWRDVLSASYIVGAAAKYCKNIALSQDEKARLLQAIAFAESKSGLAKAEMGDMAKDIDESIADNPDICITLAQSVHASIKGMQTK